MGRILVTGHSGLVGSQFNKDIIGISSKACDLRDSKSVNDIFSFYTDKEIQKEFAVDKVIHCAGRVGGIGSNMKYKGEFFYDNIMINTNVIEACRKYDIKNMVVFLSTCIFPDIVEYPLNESKIHSGPPHYSNDAYAYSKRMAEVQVKAYKEQYGLNYKCVIPTNIYGPFDNFNIDDGHVIPSLIHKCYLAKKNNTPFIIWGSGNPLREFIYSKDIAKLTLWVLENYNESEPIILSTSEEVTIKQAVETIVKYMEFDGEIIFDTTKPDGQYRKPSDNAKLKKYLPDYKFTTFDEGIKETINWFLKNYSKIRK